MPYSRRAALATLATIGFSGCMNLATESETGSHSEGNSVNCDRESVWPQFQHNATHDGKLEMDSPIRESPVVTDPLSDFEAETSVVVDGQHCYLNDGNGLTAIDRETREQQWRTSFNTPSSGTPVTSCGLIFIQTGNTTLAVEATEGTLQWKKNHGHGAPISNILVEGQTLFTCDGDVVKSLTLSGEKTWSTSGSGIFAGIALSESAVIACSAGKESDGTVQAFDYESGHHLWTTSGIESQTPPATHDSSVYLTDENGVIAALDAKTGDIQWERELETTNKTYSTPAVDKSRNQLYCPTGPRGGVVALDTATGEERWQTSAGGGFEITHSGEQLYIPGNSLYGVDPDDGSIQWSRDDIVSSGPMGLSQNALWLNAGGSLVRATPEEAQSASE